MSGVALKSHGSTVQSAGVDQQRAMRIIYADDDDYTLLLIFAGLDTLESRAHS